MHGFVRFFEVWGPAMTALNCNTLHPRDVVAYPMVVVGLLMLLRAKLIGRVGPSYESAERSFGRVPADA